MSRVWIVTSSEYKPTVYSSLKRAIESLLENELKTGEFEEPIQIGVGPNEGYRTWIATIQEGERG